MTSNFNTEQLSIEDYFLLEEDSLERHEYLQGARREMSGSTVQHSHILVNTLSIIHTYLWESSYQLFHLEIKLCVEKKNFIAYPDLMIVNGKPEMWNGRDDTISNAEVVIEIYTEKSETIDRGDKFWLYRSLPSLKEYIYISSLEVLAERYIKQPDGSWHFYEIKNRDGIFKIETIGFSCPIIELYDKVELV